MVQSKPVVQFSLYSRRTRPDHLTRLVIGLARASPVSGSASQLGKDTEGGPEVGRLHRQEVSPARDVLSQQADMLRPHSARLRGFVQTSLPSLAMVAFNNLLPFFLDGEAVVKDVLVGPTPS